MRPRFLLSRLKDSSDTSTFQYTPSLSLEASGEEEHYERGHTLHVQWRHYSPETLLES